MMNLTPDHLNLLSIVHQSKRSISSRRPTSSIPRQPRCKVCFRRGVFLSGVLFILLSSGPYSIRELQAQESKPAITATSHRTEVPPSDSSAGREGSSLAKQIVLFPMRLIESVGAFFHREGPRDNTRTKLIGRFLAYDRFQGLTNPREPIQRFVVETQKGSTGKQLLKIVYFPETTSIRGGAQFLGDQTLSYRNTWTMKVHRPSSVNERFACDNTDNFFKTPAGSPDLDENHKPILRFRSTRFQKEIKFENLSLMPCLILDALVP